MKFTLLLLALVVFCAAEPRELYHEDCLVKHCKECSSYKSCKFCDEGFWEWNGECIDCIYAIDWCEKCSNDGSKCFKCEPGFYLISDQQCGICKNGINMCKFCSHYGDVCYECIHPWELKNGKCYYNAFDDGSH